MEVTEALVDKLAQLSKLQFNAEEKAEIRADLEKMIGFVDQLNAVDTTGVAPLMHMSAEVNRLREDIPGGSMNRTEALSNAPDSNQSFFTVPKVIHK
jgi:aspartyl-tRNA(Asn)/glutamyl-tRNA(Gln) amidotransferase subunit C